MLVKGFIDLEAEVSGSEGLDTDECLEMLKEDEEDRQFIDDHISSDDDITIFLPTPIKPHYLFLKRQPQNHCHYLKW